MGGRARTRGAGAWHRSPEPHVSLRPQRRGRLRGTKCLAVALDADDRIVAERRLPTPKGGEGLVGAVADVVETLRAAAGSVAAVGVGAPGLVDGDGVVRAGPHLPGVLEFPLAAL